MGKNNFLPKGLFLLKNDFETMLFLFFFALCKWGGWVLKSAENSTLFCFVLKPSSSDALILGIYLRKETNTVSRSTVNLSNKISYLPGSTCPKQSDRRFLSLEDYKEKGRCES